VSGPRDRVGEAAITFLFGEHVIAHEASALGDAQHACVIVEPRARERRIRRAQVGECRGGAFSARELGARPVDQTTLPDATSRRGS
jgi:hypothetical protein